MPRHGRWEAASGVESIGEGPYCARKEEKRLLAGVLAGRVALEMSFNGHFGSFSARSIALKGQIGRIYMEKVVAA